MPAEIRIEVAPRWPFRLPLRNGMDGVQRRTGAMIERLLHVGCGDERRPVIVRVAQTAPDRVLFGAWAGDELAATEGIRRMRFALAIDDDLAPFHRAFRDDPLIGPSVRRTPTLRPMRRPVAYEALAWAVCEQLIEFVRAAAIERRIVRHLGHRCPETGLRDVPAPAEVAGCAPARLESFDLAGRRAIALVRASREIARGRIDLEGPDHERAWRRLEAIPTIGRWTTEVLAYHGQGRYDVVPAGDLGFIKLVGRWQSGGDPEACADEADVRAVFARYGEWAGLAASHALRAPMPVAGALAA